MVIGAVILILTIILVIEAYQYGLIEGTARGYDEAINDYEDEYRRAAHELQRK